MEKKNKKIHEKNKKSDIIINIKNRKTITRTTQIL